MAYQWRLHTQCSTHSKRHIFKGKSLAFFSDNGFGFVPYYKPYLEKNIMAKISEMLPSSYLKQSDFDEAGLIVTVSHVEQKNVAREDEPPENKWVAYFKEYEKGMVLNTTNINGLAKACDSDDTDNWPGKEVVVYVDPNVGYGGKTTGGLRIKKYNVPAAPKAAGRQVPAINPRQSTSPSIDYGRHDDAGDRNPF